MASDHVNSASGESESVEELINNAQSLEEENHPGPSKRPGRKAARNVQNLINAEKNDTCK